MKISEIQYVPIKPKNGHIGFVSFNVDDSFFVGSVAVYTRINGGIRLLYPIVRNKDADYQTIKPIKKEVGEYIENEVYEFIKGRMPNSENYDQRTQL